MFAVACEMSVLLSLFNDRIFLLLNIRYVIPYVTTAIEYVSHVNREYKLIFTIIIRQCIFTILSANEPTIRINVIHRIKHKKNIHNGSK